MTPADHFINRMLSVFHAPVTEDVTGFVAEMRKALMGWDQVTLDQAADRLAKTAKFFPKPAEVIEVCEAIIAARPQTGMPEPNREWTAAALKTANALIYSDMGRQAAREGWITQLHDHVRRERELPHGRVVVALQREARRFEDAYVSVCDGNGGALQTALKTLGETMMEKRDRLAAVAYGERVSLTNLSRRMTGEADE